MRFSSTITPLIFCFASSARALPRWTQPPQSDSLPNTPAPNNKTGSAPVTVDPTNGGAYMCTGPNWTGNCFYAEHVIGSCWIWEWTWEWVDSFGPDRDLTCTLYSNPTCASDDSSITTQFPGAPHLSSQGWLNTMESFYCTFTFSEVDKIRIVNTSHAKPATPTTTPSNWPLKSTPLQLMSNVDMPSATTSAVSASTSSADATGAGFNNTQNIARGNPGACYICQGQDWTEPCRYIVPHMGTCYSMEDWQFSAASYGPDQDARCFMYNDYACSSSKSQEVEYPGIADLVGAGWEHQLNSWRCLFEYEPGSSVKIDSIAGVEDECCSTTMNLSPPVGHATGQSRP